MCPYFFNFWQVQVPSWWVMVPLGFVIAGYFAWRHITLLWRNPRQPLYGLPSPRQLVILFACLFAGAIIGSRIFYVVWHIDRYWPRPQEIFLIFKGGFISFGGAIFALVFGIWYVKKNGLSVLRTGDVVVLYIPLADALRRFGCYLNGCCFGKPANAPYGIFLPKAIVARYPTPLYFVIWSLMIFFILRILRKHIHIDGIVFVSYFVIECFGRFFIEFFRQEYTFRKGPLIIPQVICILGIVISLTSILILSSRNKIKKNR